MKRSTGTSKLILVIGFSIFAFPAWGNPLFYPQAEWEQVGGTVGNKSLQLVRLVDAQGAAYFLANVSTVGAERVFSHVFVSEKTSPESTDIKLHYYREKLEINIGPSLKCKLTDVAGAAKEFELTRRTPSFELPNNLRLESMTRGRVRDIPFLHTASVPQLINVGPAVGRAPSTSEVNVEAEAVHFGIFVTPATPGHFKLHGYLAFEANGKFIRSPVVSDSTFDDKFWSAAPGAYEMGQKAICHMGVYYHSEHRADLFLTSITPLQMDLVEFVARQHEPVQILRHLGLQVVSDSSRSPTSGCAAAITGSPILGIVKTEK
jgi:hypothetical protein